MPLTRRLNCPEFGVVAANFVFCHGLDPVAEGVVASLARPGGNSTGLSIAPAAFWGKTLEILMEGVPGARRVAVLWDPIYSYHCRNGRPRVRANIGSEIADARDLLCLPREANVRGDHSHTRK
jgi:hypothetical protein